MTIRRLSVLQWVGLFAGAFAWAAAHVFGYGVTLAECNVGSHGWGISNDAVEATLFGVAAACAVAAGLASIVVLRGTRDTSYEGEPPLSRIRFFAIAATVSNVIFLVIVLLDVVANVSNAVCRQA